MKEPTLGSRIAALRREKGMTQAELAAQMGVTDKAVSTWERDLSIPDAASLPRLAALFEISLDRLMQGESGQPLAPARPAGHPSLLLILRAVALAMGVAVAVLSFLGAIDTHSAFGLLGIGLAALALSALADAHGA